MPKSAFPSRWSEYQWRQSCRYCGQRFLDVSHVQKAGPRDDEYRVTDNYLVRDNDGDLRFLGNGPHWALNYWTGTGACSPNLIDQDELVWSSVNHAYVRSVHMHHFMFPTIVGQFYTIRDNKKFIGPFLDKEVYILPEAYRQFTQAHDPQI